MKKVLEELEKKYEGMTEVETGEMGEMILYITGDKAYASLCENKFLQIIKNDDTILVDEFKDSEEVEYYETILNKYLV